MSEALIMAALGALYDAALDPGQWETALRRVAALFQSSAASLVLVDRLPHPGQLVVSSTLMPEAAAAAYREYYHQVDPALHAFYAGGAGAVQTTEEILAKAGLDYEENEFYRDFGAHLDLYRAMGGLILQDAGRTALFAIQRGKGSAPFSAAERQRYRDFSEHLKRALQLHRGFSTLDESHRVSQTALERLALAVITLDSQGRVLHMNRSATRLAARGEALEVAADGMLVLRSSDAARWLARRLAALVEPRLDAGASGGTAWLPRGNGAAPYALLLAPVAGERGRLGLGDGRREARALLFIKDPARQDALLAARLRLGYRLTASEAALARALLSGKRLADHAREQGIGISTARFHLKSVFRKTGTASQVELMALLVRDVGDGDLGLDEPE